MFDTVGLWYNAATQIAKHWRRIEMVTIEHEEYRRVDLIKVIGRVDSSNASQLEGALKNRQDDGRYRLVLELSGIDYMSSAGLRALVGALRESKKHSGDVRIASPSERMREVLDLAGLDSVFRIFDDATSAVGSF